MYADSTSTSICLQDISKTEHNIHPKSLILGTGVSAAIIVSGVLSLAPPVVIIGSVIFVISVEIIHLRRDR